jgi:hypothetical protein
MTDVVVMEFDMTPAEKTGDGSVPVFVGGSVFPKVSVIEPTVRNLSSGNIAFAEWYANTRLLNGTLRVEGKLTLTWPGDNTFAYEMTVTLTAVTAITGGGGGSDYKFGMDFGIGVEWTGPHTVDLAPEIDDSCPDVWTEGQTRTLTMSGTVSHT